MVRKRQDRGAWEADLRGEQEGKTTSGCWDEGGGVVYTLTPKKRNHCPMPGGGRRFIPDLLEAVGR